MKQFSIFFFTDNLTKSSLLDADGFDVGEDKPYTNGIETIMKPLGMNLVSALDKLIDLNDDDDDLFRNLESYKNKLAKEKSRHDETSSNDNSFNDSTRNIENGALAHESERKKVSLTLKPTSTLKQQTKVVSDSFVDIEQQDSNQTPNEKQTTNESNDQNEKRTSDSYMTSAKKKSSHRKDERKSRRSADRKSRRSEDRSRSRWSEDCRSKRSEDKKDEKRTKRNEERRSRRSEERHSKRSEERRSRHSEEKRSRRSEERRFKRRHDRSPNSLAHYRDAYYSPSYRNRSMSPLPRGPRTPPNTPPPNTAEFDDMAVRHMPPYSTSVVPPQAHYIPGPNQYPTPNLPHNVPNYMNEYAAYMHPNRVPVSQQYNRPPPIINSPAGMMPPIGPNNEYYYHNSSPHVAPHQLQSQPMPPNSYSNLVEVARYGAANSSNVDCIRKQSENRRKPTIAVQKGNVLEIVPSAELQCDKSAESMETNKLDKINPIDKQHQQALQWHNQERIKRKLDRHNKRMERAKRRDFLLSELNRLSHLMTVGEDGKIVKAGEILKQIEFDGTSIKLINSKENDDSDEHEAIYIEPPIHSYDPQAASGRSILSERNGSNKISMLSPK